MDLRRIRHFNVLAETLNFSRAAQRLHIAQPALSVSIQKLETELSTKLFERTSSGVSLTASGQAALVEARRLLHHGEQMVRSARDAAAGTGGKLRVGFVGSAIYRLIPCLVAAFRHQYPDVELVLKEATSTRILEMLHVEALDIGIVRTPLLQPNTLLHTVHTLQRDRLLAVLPQSHRLARQPALQLHELADEPFVMYSASDASGLQAPAITACESAGFLPRIAQEAIQVPTVIALVESGLGVALVPEVMRGHREPQVVYRDLLDAAGTETTLALACPEDRDHPAARRFIQMALALVCA